VRDKTAQSKRKHPVMSILANVDFDPILSEESVWRPKSLGIPIIVNASAAQEIGTLEMVTIEICIYRESRV
jgi:hypothetical protein